jgi:hypothetical protein
MANIITLEVERVDSGAGNAPGTVTGINVDSGERVALKGWADTLADFRPGKTFQFQWYLGKEYRGEQDMLVSKHGDVKEIFGAVASLDKPNGSQDPSDDLPAAFYEKKAPAPPAPPAPAPTTPQAIMTGSPTAKDRTITCLAVMKSVIESGGTEEDFDRWLAKLDATVSRR